MARILKRPAVQGLLCVAIYLTALALVRANASGDAPRENPPADTAVAVDSTTPSPPGERVRQGTQIVDRRGTFRTTGSRVYFSTLNEGKRFVCLENLNLERITRATAESVESQEWLVTGTITEYRGANYLLIERAVVREQMGVLPESH